MFVVQMKDINMLKMYHGVERYTFFVLLFYFDSSFYNFLSDSGINSALVKLLQMMFHIQAYRNTFVVKIICQFCLI